MSRDWRALDHRLVMQGTILVDLHFLKKQKQELKRMNAGKEGKPFEFSDSFVRYAGNIRCLFRLPYRQTKGVLIGIGWKVKGLRAPHYSNLQRRFNSLNIRLRLHKTNEPLWVAIDASGISVTNRGEWMRKVHRKSRIDDYKGFLKIHVAIDIKTKEVTAIEVTREDVGDNRMFKPLLAGTVENTKQVIERVYGDGCYDTYDNFEGCHQARIQPIIRIDDNAITDPPPQDFIHRNRQEPIRTIHARKQLANREQWKKETQYGLRWAVEGFFSVFKRRHGEYAMAKKFENMQQEMLFKTNLYNQLI